MPRPNLPGKDFRMELYKKYNSAYKQYIGNEDSANIKSDYEIYARKLLPLLNEFPKTASLIDLGCGSGYILQFLKKNGFQNLYGIDISEEQIKKAKQKGLNTEVKDIFDLLETENKKYDIVFALDFIEHFHKNELLDILLGIKNILNENGALIIRTPNGQGLFPGKIVFGDLTHLTIFNPNSLGQILRAVGFDKFSFYETGPVPKNFSGIIRVILWKIVKIFINSIKIIERGLSENILTAEFICKAKVK